MKFLCGCTYTKSTSNAVNVDNVVLLVYLLQALSISFSFGGIYVCVLIIIQLQYLVIAIYIIIIMFDSSCADRLD